MFFVPWACSTYRRRTPGPAVGTVACCTCWPREVASSENDRPLCCVWTGRLFSPHHRSCYVCRSAFIAGSLEDSERTDGRMDTSAPNFCLFVDGDGRGSRYWKSWRSCAESGAACSSSSFSSSSSAALLSRALVRGNSSGL